MGRIRTIGGNEIECTAARIGGGQRYNQRIRQSAVRVGLLRVECVPNVAEEYAVASTGYLNNPRRAGVM